MATHNELGKQGEKAAEKFLLGKGYRILHKNWRYKHKEIDIIAQHKELLVIAEVKSRASTYFGNPKDAVTRKKQKILFEAAGAYINRYNIHMEARFDIISVIVNGQTYEIEHIEDAFNSLG